MTRRTARTRPVAAQLVLAPVLVLLLAACGGTADDAARGTARPAVRQDAPSAGPADGGHEAVDRGSPGSTAAAYFAAVRDARFGDACALLAPVVLARYASAGQDCQTAMSELFNERTRAAIGDVATDESKVQVVGDTASVPGIALRRTDLPAGAEAPSFPDLRATRQGGAWYLLPEGAGE